MQVAELRQRLIGKMAESAVVGDEAAAAVMLGHARAALVALAQHPEDKEVSLAELTVGAKTAALILGLHPEYVRFLIRRGRLDATKENGEYTISLNNIADFTVAGMQSPSREASMMPNLGDILTGAMGYFTLWQQPEESTGSSEPPA